MSAVGHHDGAAGVDGQECSAYTRSDEAWAQWRDALLEELRTKTYRPSPVRRVRIPKGDGKTRPLRVRSQDVLGLRLRGWPGCTPPPPAKLPSKKWRDIILQVWHIDPLQCPVCQKPMRVIAVIDQCAAVEKILRHLGLWSGTPPLAPARAPPDGDADPWTREPCADVDPMPDYENVITD